MKMKLTDREKKTIHFALILMATMALVHESQQAGLADWMFVALAVVVEVA